MNPTQRTVTRWLCLTLLAAGLGATVGASAVDGQRVGFLVPGMRVRITFEVESDSLVRRIGSVETVSADSFALRLDDGGSRFVTEAQLRGIETSTGRRSWARRGMLIGAGAGAAGGTIALTLLCRAQSCDSPGNYGPAIVVLGSLIVPTVVGAVVGGFFHYEGWRPLRVTVRPIYRSRLSGPPRFGVSLVSIRLAWF